MRGTSEKTVSTQKAIQCKIGHLKDVVDLELLSAHFVRSKQNKADALTKPMSGAEFLKIRRDLELFPLKCETTLPLEEGCENNANARQA